MFPIPDTQKTLFEHGGRGNASLYFSAEKGFTIAFGKQPLAVRRDGSIPIIPTFEKIFGMKSVPILFWKVQRC